MINKDFLLPCGVLLKNRIAKSAMSENMGTPNYNANAKFLELYKRWSNGGASLLITGNVMIDKTALGEPGNVVFDETVDKEILKKWAEFGGQNKTQIWVQLNHPGKQSPKFLSKTPVAPSAISFPFPLNKSFNTPRELTEAEIEIIIQRFAYAAKISKSVGFTGVQIHGAHGYLVSQFLSPKHNQRQDKWGGSLENRMRFVLSIYDRIREAVGSKFPIGIKLNSADFQKGGFTKEESIEVVKALADRGMDLIEISGGTYEAPTMMGSQPKKAVSTQKREAYFLEYCEEVRKHTSVPLMLTGGFRSLEGMKAALESGACDIIGLGRSVVINPDFPNALLAAKLTKSEVHPLTTGFAKLDKMIPIEITWYTNQIHRIGKGQNPKPKMNVIVSIMHSVFKTGVQSIRRVR